MDLGSPPSQGKVQLWLFLSLIGSSLEPVLIKYFKPSISPLSLIVLKSLVAFLLVLPFFRKLRLLSKKDYLPLFLVSILAFITNGLIFLSLQSIPATTLITIITTTPILVAILNHKKGSERLSAQFILAFTMVLIGVFLTLEVFLKDEFFTINLGIGVAFLAVLTSAMYRLRMGRITQTIDPLLASVALFSFNGFLSLLLLPFVSIPLHTVSLGIWLGFAGVVANIFFLYAIKHLGSTRVSVLSVTQRPIAVLIGAFLLHETLSPLQVLGMVCIFMGVYFAKMKRPRLS